MSWCVTGNGWGTRLTIRRQRDWRITHLQPPRLSRNTFFWYVILINWGYKADVALENVNSEVYNNYTKLLFV